MLQPGTSIQARDCSRGTEWPWRQTRVTVNTWNTQTALARRRSSVRPKPCVYIIPLLGEGGYFYGVVCFWAMFALGATKKELCGYRCNGGKRRWTMRGWWGSAHTLLRGQRSVINFACISRSSHLFCCFLKWNSLGRRCCQTIGQM